MMETQGERNTGTYLSSTSLQNPEMDELGRKQSPLLGYLM
jgi:hypothetical protein